MSPRRRNLIAIAVLLAGGASYLLFHTLWESRYSLQPVALASTFGLQSTPDSMTAASCREEWPECTTDYVVTTCVGSISPDDFPRFISQSNVSEEKLLVSSRQQVGFRFGPSFNVAVAYRVNTTKDSPEYVSLTTESGYGDLYIYANADKTRYALRKRILTAVDCF